MTTSNAPPEDPEYTSEPKVLSPVSPKPLHYPAPQNIPLLEKQIDQDFNQTSAHMSGAIVQQEQKQEQQQQLHQQEQSHEQGYQNVDQVNHVISAYPTLTAAEQSSIANPLQVGTQQQQQQQHHQQEQLQTINLGDNNTQAQTLDTITDNQMNYAAPPAHPDPDSDVIPAHASSSYEYSEPAPIHQASIEPTPQTELRLSSSFPTPVSVSAPASAPACCYTPPSHLLVCPMYPHKALKPPTTATLWPKPKA